MTDRRNTYGDEGGPVQKKTGIQTYPGKIIRLDNTPAKKDLLGLDVCINDSSDYSLYYFYYMFYLHSILILKDPYNSNNSEYYNLYIYIQHYIDMYNLSLECT